MRARDVLAVAVLSAAMLWPAATASAGGGCYGPATHGEGDTVAMAEACFGPSVLTVDPGTDVRFVNKDAITHNVSAMGWSSPGDLSEGDSFTTTFQEEGTFPYACMYHAGMSGAVVVGDGQGPGSGELLEVGSISDSSPAAATTRTAASRPSEASSGGDWALAGGIGLVIGAGLMALIRRRQPQA